MGVTRCLCDRRFWLLLRCRDIVDVAAVCDELRTRSQHERLSPLLDDVRNPARGTRDDP